MAVWYLQAFPVRNHPKLLIFWVIGLKSYENILNTRRTATVCYVLTVYLMGCLEKNQLGKSSLKYQGKSWENINTCFSDASQDAYWSSGYIRNQSPDNVINVSLLCSKTKVASNKQNSIPRLQLFLPLYYRLSYPNKFVVFLI